MAVYVDNAVFRWRGRRWAHLMADTLHELHLFAAALGLPRRRFQDKRSGAHYDIDSTMRDVALRLGAVAVSRHDDRARMREIIANARRQWSGFVASTGEQDIARAGGDTPDRNNATDAADHASPSRPSQRIPEIIMSVFDLSPPDNIQRAALSDTLSPEERRVLLAHGTEAPFCGVFLDNKRDGVYVCRFCGLPLFRSNAKFDSGTGWPSFFAPYDESHIGRIRDVSHGMVRVEIVCERCASHLGHVFPDGPPPTGERHCLNSVSLAFVGDDEPLPDPLKRGEATLSFGPR